MRDVHDRDREVYSREVRYENQVIRENDSAASGLIVGITLATLAGLGVAAYFLFNSRPAVQQPAKNTTIIEKTREVVPVPQKAPDVNITVPSNPPAVELPDINVTPTRPEGQQVPTSEPAPASPQTNPEAAPTTP